MMYVGFMKNSLLADSFVSYFLNMMYLGFMFKNFLLLAVYFPFKT